jgi:hypothetical protein
MTENTQAAVDMGAVALKFHRVERLEPEEAAALFDSGLISLNATWSEAGLRVLVDAYRREDHARRRVVRDLIDSAVLVWRHVKGHADDVRDFRAKARAALEAFKLEDRK